MKKRLLNCVGVGLFCLMAMPAMADCVCGTTGCKPCDDTEDYLEDVGEHMKKQSKRLNKKMKKHSEKSAEMGASNCAANQPMFWEEEAAALNKNGDLILYYAELVDDDTFVLTKAQKTKAAADAKTLKQSGQALKDKAAAQKETCMQDVSVVEEVVEYAPQKTKADKKAKHSIKKNHQKSAPAYGYMWVDQMEQNGNMLVDVGEFIETNMTK